MEYAIMHEIVMRYCNQDYPIFGEPLGLNAIINKMCEYVENSMNSNKKSETIATYSYTVDEKELFQTFAGLLSPYKRLRTL